MHRRAGISLLELILVCLVLMAVGLALLYPMYARPRPRGSHRSPSSNTRQVGLAAIMYGGDYDDRIPLLTNGWISRIQDRHDSEKTVSCPGPGTQREMAADAAGARPTRTWVGLTQPYLKARGLLVDPERGDLSGYFKAAPASVTDPGYDRHGPTYRNQGKFPYFGINYMFLAPLRIPKKRLASQDAFNYAEGEARAFPDATDPAGTVFFTTSRRSLDDTTRGFFAVNAPGMWNAFANNKDGYVGFWEGSQGSGDWVGTRTACKPSDRKCMEPIPSTGSAYNHSWDDAPLRGYTQAVFLDGHVKAMKLAELAAGTDFLTAVAGRSGNLGSGSQIVDKKAYLWDLVGNAAGP